MNELYTTKTNITVILSRLLSFLGIMLIVAFILPTLAFSQATVDLGTSANFGILAQAGISGSGIVIGNLGTSTLTISGGISAPGYTNYPPADPVVMTALSDLNIAYTNNNATNLLGGSVLSTSSWELGSSTLHPGVYKIGSSAAITGTLTLDGNGVYIFQIGSTLTTTAYTGNVNLINGALWSNIFWLIGTSATLGVSTTFNGNILAYTSITVNTNTTLHSRLLAGAGSLTGAVVLDNNTVLPVELSSFTSIVNGRNILLNWSTSTEKNSNQFIIEKMTPISSWLNIGSVKASDLSNSKKEYSFIDKNLQSGKYQYRLRMIDNDGTFEYSKIIETECIQPGYFELDQNYPNPFNPSTKINYNLPYDSKVTLEVYNIVGKRIGELVNEEQTAGYYSVNYGSSRLSSGIYFYKMTAVEKATGKNFSSIKKMMLLK